MEGDLSCLRENILYKSIIHTILSHMWGAMSKKHDISMVTYPIPLYFTVLLQYYSTNSDNCYY